MVSPASIRAATPADAATAAQLLTAQLLDHHLPADPEGIARGVALALTPGAQAWLLLAFRDGTPVGISLANPIVSVEHGGWVLWIEELYVTPEARRSGVARALLAHIVERARREGIQALELEVVPGQDAAFALYDALGFQALDRRPRLLLL